ncbi:MAG: LPXTG cell wall anchor domain-containing protein [Myxococcales bacterium]|nr:LPXTG cell wall anchor domain-containing protein [Myxococcales bacterium]
MATLWEQLRAKPWLTGTTGEGETMLWSILAIALLLAAWGAWHGLRSREKKQDLAP